MKIYGESLLTSMITQVLAMQARQIVNGLMYLVGAQAATTTNIPT